MMAFRDLPAGRWNNVIAVILIGVFGAIRASGDARACWSWANVVLGVWMIISPFVLGFSGVVTAMWHNVIAGIVLVVLSWSRVFLPSHRYTLEHHA